MTEILQNDKVFARRRRRRRRRQGYDNTSTFSSKTDELKSSAVSDDNFNVAVYKYAVMNKLIMAKILNQTV